MNIKDKLTICLMIILVIVLGCILKSNSNAVMGQYSDKGLALLAKNDIDKFISTIPESTWFNTSLDTYIGKNNSDSTIAQSSATCLYEEEAYTDGSKYHVTNVININWDETKNDYHAWGWWPDSSSADGVSGGELTSINKSYNKLLELDIFLQAMYNAYTSSKTYLTTTEKSAMKSYFYKGIDNGGFLTLDDGIGLNIDTSFLGIWNGEALTYKDSSSNYTAQNLIQQYSANNNTGYGLTINGESTCIKEKDTDGDYTIFGPFNIHFVRSIDNISIVGEAKSWKTNVDGNNIYYSYDKVNWSNEYSNIKANTNFYIKISDSGQEFYSQSSNITITFNQKSIQTYQARFILLKSGGNGQNLMIYAARKRPLYTAKAEYTVKGNTLRVVKYGLLENESIEESENKQADVGFIINNGSKYLKYNNGSQIVKIGQMNYNKTDFSWIEDRNSATIFETVNTVENGVNWNGYFQISNMPAGKYYIGEIYNKNSGYENSLITAYKLEYEGEPSKEDIYGEDVQIGDNISGYTEHNIQVINVELAADGYTKVLRVYDSLLSDFNITLNKVNTSGTKIGQAEFKIQVLDANENIIGWLQKASDTEYSYNSYYKDATVWCSTANADIKSPKDRYVYASTKGVISITGLNTDYQYKIYEFKEGNNCYSLSEQVKKGMSVSINNTTVSDIKYNKKTTSSDKYVATDENIYCGITSDTLNKTKASITIKNISKVPHPSSSSTVDISGIVWLDGLGNKNNSGNGTYGDGIDQYLSGVKVYLKKVGTDEIVKYNGNNFVTTENGKYTFLGSITGIKSSNLSNYYIEIEYSGLGTTYSIVTPGDAANQSKAKYYGDGKASTGAIDSSNYQHMNIGIVENKNNDESITKEIAYIKTKIKGEEFVYKYGEIVKSGNNKGAFSKIDIGNKGYYRTIYSSDIIYNQKGSPSATEKLQVEITYAITVKNNSNINSTLYDENDLESPDDKITSGSSNHERYMKVEVYDKYNEDYYKLVENDTTQTKNSTQKGKWNKSNKGIAKYESEITLNNSTKSNNSTTLYVTYQLTDKALNKILTEGTFTEEKGAYMTGAHYKAVHKFWYEYWDWVWTGRSWQFEYIRDYYKWFQSNDSSDSTYNTSFTRSCPPPSGMRFSIYEQDGKTVAQRTISGTVFEDENINSEGKILGDGEYDVSASSKENSIQGVKVELMCADSNKINGTDKKVATRYIYSEKEDENGNIVRKGEAVTKNEETSLYGTYTFDGIIPGDYYIRFTYGNGQQKIIKANGTTDGEVTAYEYKSTIVKDTTLQNLIKKDRNSKEYNDNDYYWYRNLTANGFSTAVDVLGDRETFNQYYISSKKYNIRAYTPTFKISLENEKENEKNNKDVEDYKIENMNFGIIDTPEIELGFEKVMTNIKVTNTSGQIIIDGNPSKSEIKNLSNLDDKVHLIKEGGSDYAKIEINNEELYGAKLEITYAITIINNSDVNYYEKKGSDYYGYYYMFGEIINSGGDSNETHEVTITIDTVKDYLDKKLEVVGNDREISNKNTYKEEQYTLNFKDWKILYTQKNPSTDKSKTKDTVQIIVARTLSNQDTNIDTTFENQVEVTEFEVTDKPELVESINKYIGSKYDNYFKYEFSGIKFVNPSVNNSLIITPPTGSDKITPIIYIITTVISGIIITIGIIVIKKKVLNK